MTVYKYLTADRFSQYFENYLDGELFFADWHIFNDKKEGKYLWNSSRVDEETAKQLKKDLKEAKNSYTVCSTAKSGGIFRMWDMYADNHKGVCIDIDVNENSIANNSIQRFEVGYTERLQQYDDLQGGPDEKALSVLTKKLTCWKPEEEIRFIQNSKKQRMHKIGDLKEIILGANFMNNELFQRIISHESCGNFTIKHATVPMDTVTLDTNI